MRKFSPKIIKDHPQLWTAITAAVLGLAIYSPVGQLPFFVDDIIHLRWFQSASLFDIWFGNQGAISYYLPVPNTVFKLLWQLQGASSAATLHFLVLALHILNAFMVGLLARRLTRRDLAGPIAAALFIVFPFAYEDISRVTGIFHVALVAGLLLTILFSLRFLDRGSRIALIGAWLSAFVAIFSHENGVLLPVLLGLILLVILYQEGTLSRYWRRTFWIFVPLVALVVVFLVAWFTIPKGTNDASSGLQWAAMDTKAVYAAQTVIYPLSALERLFLPNTDSAVIPALTLAVILGVGGAIASLWWLTVRVDGRKRPSIAMLNALVALTWIVFSAIPILLLLPTPYVLGSPRLLYLPGVGVALFWTAWLAGLVSSRRSRFISIVGAVVFATFMLIGLVFTLHRVDAHVRLGSAYTAFFQGMESNPQPTLLVNAPEYTAPTWEGTTFLRGSEGVVFLPDFFKLQDLVWANTGTDYPVQAASFRDIVTQTADEIVKPADPALNWDQFDQVLSTVQSVDLISRANRAYTLLHVGDKGFQVSASQPLADFGQVVLWQAHVALHPGSPAVLSLAWEVKSPLPATPFVHALCNGVMVAQADGPPLGGIHPFDHWKPGERWTDQRSLSSACQVYVGLTNPMTGQRLPAHLSDGSTSDNILVPIQPQ